MQLTNLKGDHGKLLVLNQADSVFSHGQLYVGLSIGGSLENLFIIVSESKIRNIIDPEALNSRSEYTKLYKAYSNQNTQ